MTLTRGDLLALITLGGLLVIALVLGLVLGLKIKNDKEVGVMNSYGNTKELIKKFPVRNATYVNENNIEGRIQNRLLTGFENWNRGFKVWKAWGDILYTPDSIYNVHGARLNLAHYQAAMDASLQQADIQMGAFHNMLIVGNFCAIHYDFVTGGRTSKVMEFVKFKEHRTEANPDTRVEEGWGSTKDNSYYGLISYQGSAEKEEQEGLNYYLLNYQLPTDYNNNLTLKYPVVYPNDYSFNDSYLIINQIILEGFESWNQNYSEYVNWVNKYYEVGAFSSSLKEVERNMTTYKDEIEALFKSEKITKLYFDNILIRDYWAAIHYRYRRENKSNRRVYVGDRMEFFKFKKEDNSFKIVANWIQ